MSEWDRQNALGAPPAKLELRAQEGADVGCGSLMLIFLGLAALEDDVCVEPPVSRSFLRKPREPVSRGGSFSGALARLCRLLVRGAGVRTDRSPWLTSRT